MKINEKKRRLQKSVEYKEDIIRIIILVVVINGGGSGDGGDY